MAYFVSNPTEPNYYFIDSVAYTEDHVPVKKLCWCDAPSKLKESTLCSYFELFGPVLEIKMFSNNSSMFQSGYVIYDNVKDAARALRTCNHKVNGIEFLVEASDSWDQPDAYGSSPEELQGPSLILGLNDYCLEHIMAKLELQDKVRFAKTCLRIRAIFKRESARLHTCVDLGQFRNMTVWDIRYYFQLFGAHIQVLYGKFEADHSERLAQFIRDYCRNLKSVQVVCSPGIGLHMHTIFANMNQLEELQLHNSDIADEPLLDLENLINLKKLTLSNNFLTGSTLAELPVSIEVLGLNECRDLEAKYLPEMCRRLPKLRELNIQNVNTSPLRVFKIMVTDNCCPSLEVLRVTAFPYTTYEFLPQLPKLKHLTICNPLTNYPAFTDSLCRILICELVKVQVGAA
uniref:Uncharacterized protein LOC108041695 isoform X1 n=1 Tax=Drosophila rhopaloa TaxID=1041015 RepID=A0A6P4EJL4_DRORH